MRHFIIVIGLLSLVACAKRPEPDPVMPECFSVTRKTTSDASFLPPELTEKIYVSGDLWRVETLGTANHVVGIGDGKKIFQDGELVESSDLNVWWTLKFLFEYIKQGEFRGTQKQDGTECYLYEWADKEEDQKVNVFVDTSTMFPAFMQIYGDQLLMSTQYFDFKIEENLPPEMFNIETVTQSDSINKITE